MIFGGLPRLRVPSLAPNAAALAEERGSLLAAAAPAAAEAKAAGFAPVWFPCLCLFPKLALATGV